MGILKKSALFLAILTGIPSCGGDPGWELAPGIIILDRDDPLESFADLTERISGRAIFVDRWATWCAPCLEEFAHLDKLIEFLESHNIALLFLNADGGLEEDYWFDFIQEHNLRGYHARLSQNLMRDLIDKGAFLPYIPQYLIINQQGEIIEKNALRPSAEEDLYRQLSEELEL